MRNVHHERGIEARESVSLVLRQKQLLKKGGRANCISGTIKRCLAQSFNTVISEVSVETSLLEQRLQTSTPFRSGAQPDKINPLARKSHLNKWHKRHGERQT